MTLVSQSALLAAPGQDLRLPVAAIVCNQSPPVGDAPSLMTMECVPRSNLLQPKGAFTFSNLAHAAALVMTCHAVMVCGLQ